MFVPLTIDDTLFHEILYENYIMGYSMKPMTKLLDIIGPVLIIALLAMLTAEPYYRESFYYPFLFLNFLVFLAIWMGAAFLLKTTVIHPRPKGFFWKASAVWSIASILSSLINHLILSGFLARSGGHPRFFIPMLLLTFVFGLMLVLGWLYGITLFKFIFTSPQLGWLKVVIQVVLSLLALALIFIVGLNLQIRRRVRDRITSIDEVKLKGVAIVFGAGVYQEAERPSQVLRDRIEMAAQLVENGMSESVILSGDGSGNSIEVDVMERYALEVGIPEALLTRDNAGVRTYETCARAQSEFGVTEAILVTQKFHLQRALYLCESLGVQAVGVSADQTRYSLLSHMIWALRESLATTYAWLEVIGIN